MFSIHADEFMRPVIAVLLALAILVLGGISFVRTIGWPWWQRQTTYRSLQELPAPPIHWLLGNLPQILAAVKQKQLFRLLFDWSQELGPIYVYWMSYPVIVVSRPKVIDDIIVTGMRDGSFVRSRGARIAWNDISGPILLGQEGADWQWRRKAWNPEFSASGLSSYGDVLRQACTQVIDRLKTVQPLDAVQMDPLFVELTMRVISGLMLGVPIDPTVASPEGPALDTQKVYQAMSVIGYRFLRLATGEKPWMKYLPTRSARDYWAARRYLEAFLLPRIDLALQLRDQPQTDPSVSSLFLKSMLVKIAAKEPKYTREALIAESIELLIAGTDTTAHTLSFVVGELALNPRVFQKAQAIVDAVYLQRGEITIESLKELNYLPAIVKETLRLYSVASGSTSLEATRNTVVAGIAVPPGTKVFWSMLAAGRDPDTYPQPEEFLPERWLEGDRINSSLPMVDFGSGLHRCLGENLAMLEATMMLAYLLRYFHWELVNGRSSLENLQQNLLIYPVDGMPLRLHLREGMDGQTNLESLGL